MLTIFLYQHVLIQCFILLVQKQFFIKGEKNDILKNHACFPIIVTFSGMKVVRVITYETADTNSRFLTSLSFL